MLLSSLIYGILWHKANKKSQQKEVDRIGKLRASGLLGGSSEVKGEGEKGRG